MTLLQTVENARICLAEGGVIAYPTEAVYGLGCSPFEEKAVERILALKQRRPEMGLIVLAGDWAQLDRLVKWENPAWREQVAATWPGPVTWVFPKSEQVPAWVTGSHQTIAVRMSAHPVASALCKDGPLISTSANISGSPPAKTLDELFAQFPKGLDMVVEGELGRLEQPSMIRDIRTGKRLR